MRFFKVSRDYGTLVKDELYTAKEVVKLYHDNGYSGLFDRKILVPVEVSKRKTFWNFGCRFEMKGDSNE